jgi:hypothetical protein
MTTEEQKKQLRHKALLNVALFVGIKVGIAATIYYVGKKTRNTKVYDVVSQGEVGVFDDGTIRLRLSDFEEMLKTGKRYVLDLEDIGRFSVQGFPNGH